jgi:hypothetical protein
MGCDDAAMCSHMNLLMKYMSKRLEHDLVDVAPAPVFTGLEGLDKGVAGRMEMPGGVFVLRGVATANVPTDKALAQVYPGIANFQAILAAISTRGNFLDLVEVRTIRCHQFFSFFLSLATARLATTFLVSDKG